MHMPNFLLRSHKTFRRWLRTALEISLPMLGVAVVLSAVLFLGEVHTQLTVVVGGILLIEGGVWKAARCLLPSERQYLPLRREVDQFIVLIRALNSAALAVKSTNAPEHHQALEGIQQLMRQAVDRMAELAGKTDAEVDAARQSIPATAGQLKANMPSTG